MIHNTRISKLFAFILFALANHCVLGAHAAQAAQADTTDYLGLPSLIQIGSDPFDSSVDNNQHRSALEPSAYALGRTIVTAYQAGRVKDGGGATNVGWSHSGDGGKTWLQGTLPHTITRDGGIYDRVTDPAVGFDEVHGLWMISTLAFSKLKNMLPTLLIHRSKDGVHWEAPIVASQGAGYDKNWIACDNQPHSKFAGTCYLVWQLDANANQFIASRSTDGGLTWSKPALTPKGAGRSLGGIPLIQPDGTVVVPMAIVKFPDLLGTMSIRSTDGGVTWDEPVIISELRAGGDLFKQIRRPALPSAGIDEKGNIFVVWASCLFRVQCSANDLVMSSSLDGISWTLPQLIPTASRNSNFDHMLPGLGVSLTRGGKTQLALTYYSTEALHCDSNDCPMTVHFISSSDGGKNWNSPSALTAPFSLNHIAKTKAGAMVGDYIQTVFAEGNDSLKRAFPIFSLGLPAVDPRLSFEQSIFTVRDGIAIAQ